MRSSAEALGKIEIAVDKTSTLHENDLDHN
jgi:hypothetical protein